MNVVLLQGRLSSEPRTKALPSGDRLTSWEVTTVVDGHKLSVPVVWFGGPRTIESIAEGDEVVVAGTVRRRFYRAGQGATSVTEVVAHRWARPSRPAAVRKLLDAAKVAF